MKPKKGSKLISLSGIQNHFQRFDKKLNPIAKAHNDYRLGLVGLRNAQFLNQNQETGSLMMASREEFMSSARQSEIQRSLAFWFAKKSRPSNMVEDEGFLQLCYNLNPAFKPPSRNTMVRNIISLSKECEAVVICMLAAHKTENFGRGLMGGQFDGWTSETQGGFVSFNVSFIPAGKSKVVFVCLRCARLDNIGDGSHSTENLTLWITKVLREYGLEFEDILEWVTDNAPNVRGVWEAIEGLKLKFNRYTRELVPVENWDQKGRGCACHTLALSVADCIAVMRDASSDATDSCSVRRIWPLR